MIRRLAGAVLVSVALHVAPAAAAVDALAIMDEAIAINGRDGLDAALRYLRDTIAADRADGAADPEIAGIYSMLAEAVLGQGDADEAMRLVQEGLALARSAPEPNLEVIADLTGDRGTILDETGDPDGAIAAWTESVRMFDEGFGKLAEINRLRLRLAARLEQAGRFDEAIDVRIDVVATLADGSDPDGLIEAWYRLAMVLRDTDRFDDTLVAHERLLAVVDAYRPAVHPDRVEALNAMGVFLLTEGHVDEALKYLTDAAAVADRLETPVAAGAEVRQNLGFAYRHLGRVEEAEAEMRRADAVWESLGPGQQMRRAHNLNGLTAFFSERGRLDDALAVSEEAMELVRGYEDFASGIPLNTYDIRASLLVLAQRPSEAAELSRASLTGWLKIREPDSEAVILARQNLASVLVRLGAYDEARNLVDAALAAAEKTLAPDNETFGLIYSTLGTILGDVGDFAGARQASEKSLAVWRKAAPGTFREARAIANLAAATSQLGEDAETEALLRQAIAIYERVAPDHPDLDNVYSNLATLLRDQGLLTESEAFARHTLERAEALGGDRLATATALYDVAYALYVSGRYAEAEPLLVRALEIQRNHLPAEHPTIANTLNNLGLVLWELGRYGESGQLAAEALAMRQALLPPNHPDIAASLGNIATIFDAAGQTTRAGLYYRRSIDMAEEIFGRDHPNYILKASNYATMLYSQAGRPEEALAIFRDVVARLARMSEEQATITAGAGKRLNGSRSILTNYVGAAWEVARRGGPAP